MALSPTESIRVAVIPETLFTVPNGVSPEALCQGSGLGLGLVASLSRVCTARVTSSYCSVYLRVVYILLLAVCAVRDGKS